jgi:hypothetical protein
MLKLHIVEQTHYNYDRDTKSLRRQPYKVYRVSASSNEGGTDVRQALDDVIKDLADVRLHLGERE